MQHYRTNELREVVRKHAQNLFNLKPDKIPAQKGGGHISKDK